MPLNLVANHVSSLNPLIIIISYCAVYFPSNNDYATSANTVNLSKVFRITANVNRRAVTNLRVSSNFLVIFHIATGACPVMGVQR